MRTILISVNLLWKNIQFHEKITRNISRLFPAMRNDSVRTLRITKIIRSSEIVHIRMQ